MTKSLIRIFIVLLIPTVISLYAYSSLKTFFFEAADSKNTAQIVIEVPSDGSFRGFCKDLEEKGIIKHWRVLDIISQVKGSDTQIQAGEYELSPSMTPQEIIAKLSSGDVLKRIVTIKEGMDLWDIAKEYSAKNLLAEDEFLTLVKDRSLLDRVDIKADSFEGYLFPETYQYSGKLNTINAIWRMLEEFHKNWSSEYNDRLAELNFTIHEIITLASIIEKESGNSEEQPIIASVFYNRLKNGMRLESDPTLVYGNKTYGGVVTNKHKNTESPYNTYKNYGLPPGPICNPGKTAIKAALYPAETDYIFFVADGKGGHVFTKTLREHNEAVRAYRAILKEKGLR